MPTHRETIGAQVVALVLVGCVSGRGEGAGADEPGREEGELSEGALSDSGKGEGAQSDGAQSDGEPSDEGQSERGSDESESSGESGDPETESDTESESDTEETTGGTGMANCEDDWEPNSSAEQASMISWDAADEWSAYREIDDAALCPGDDDWFRLDVDGLEYDEHYLYVRALVKEAGLCGAGCGDPVIPAGPQHAMTIEVYGAADGALLASETDDDGVVKLNGPGGEAYSHDLLIHVFSPTLVAEYPYRLSISIRNYDGEDECEC